MDIDKKIYVKNMWFLIPAVSLCISLLYMIGYTYVPLKLKLISIASNIFITTGIWLGCTNIVIFLWKKYPWEIKPVKHLILEIIAILIYTNIFITLYDLLVIHYIYKNEIEYTRADIVEGFIVTNIITFLITAIYEAVFFYKQWKENFSKSARLEKDNIQAKYETLKSQINPHFLFNSLNSLTAIVDENTEAVSYIDNLSEFLRYILKSRDYEIVLVRNELSMLKKYVSLQKSRFKDNLVINIDINEKYYHYSVPPLVLQILVENCVKHNIIGKDAPLKINVFINRETIVVENNFQPRTDVSSTGQGLQNIKDRYKFFTTNEVKVIQTNSFFKVEIPLLLVEL